MSQPPADVCLVESGPENGLRVELAKPEGGKARRFAMLAYSGAPVRFGAEQVVIDLAGMQILSQHNPILRQHDPNRIAGYSDRVAKTDKALEIEGVLSGATESGREVASLADEGLRWQASVGLQVSKWRELGEQETVVINGREVSGPAYVAVKSVLRESSFVPMGADPGTKGVVLSSVAPAGGGLAETLAPVGREEPMQMEDAALEAERKKSGEAAVKAERERVAAIKAAFPNDFQFALQQIEAGTDVLAAKAAYADKLQADLAASQEAVRKAEEHVVKLQAAGRQAGPAPVGFAGGAQEGAEGKDFLALAQEHAESSRCGIQQAMSVVARKHPELHAAFVEAQRAKPARKAERAPAK